MNRRALRIGARAAGIAVLWTITSSALFVLLGRLWTVYPPPAMFWQWWHYALFGSRSALTLRLLGISAALPTVLLIVGVVRAARHWGQQPRPLYGTTAWPTDEEIKRAGFDL